MIYALKHRGFVSKIMKNQHNHLLNIKTAASLIDKKSFDPASEAAAFWITSLAMPSSMSRIASSVSGGIGIEIWLAMLFLLFLAGKMFFSEFV